MYVKNKAGFTAKLRKEKERVVPLNQKLYDVLGSVKNKRGYCFRFNADWVTEKLNDLAEKAGIKGVTLNTLRHTFASHLAMQGVSLFHIAQWLGHSTTHVTELYAHLCKGNPGRGEIDLLSF